jgi:sporulation protein YlmC with PRC-barrel domain
MSNHSVVKASQITGVKVKNTDGEKLGEINEMVIDKLTGKINYLVLDFNGILEFGNKFFAVPWSLFHYDPNDECFLLKVSKEKLKDAPGFDKDNWPDVAEAQFSEKISNHYK